HPNGAAHFEGVTRSSPHRRAGTLGKLGSTTSTTLLCVVDASLFVIPALVISRAARTVAWSLLFCGVAGPMYCRVCSRQEFSNIQSLTRHDSSAGVVAVYLSRVVS